MSTLEAVISYHSLMNPHYSHYLRVVCAEAQKKLPQTPDNLDITISTSCMPNTLASAIAAKPATIPFQSKQPRFVILPRERHADLRLSAHRSDEDVGGHGPGTYTAYTSLGKIRTYIIISRP